MILEEDSMRTGRGTKSLDSLYRYGLIVIRIDIQIQNFLQMSYDWCRRSRKNINMSMVLLKYITCGRVERLPQHSALAKWQRTGLWLRHAWVRIPHAPLCIGFRLSSDAGWIFFFPLPPIATAMIKGTVKCSGWLQPLLQLAVKNCNSSKKTDITATLYLFATQEA